MEVIRNTIKWYWFTVHAPIFHLGDNYISEAYKKKNMNKFYL